MFPAVTTNVNTDDAQVEKDLFTSTSQTEAESLEFPSFDKAFFDGSFQSVHESSTGFEHDPSFHEAPSLERDDSQSTDTLQQVETETSTDVSDGGEIQMSTSRLRKSFSMGKRMRFRGGKQKKKGFPLPRHPSHSADETADTPLIEWFDSQNGSDVLADDRNGKEALVSSIAVDEVGQVELAVVTSENLAAADQVWSDDRAVSDDMSPLKVVSKSQPIFPSLPKSAKKIADVGEEEGQQTNSGRSPRSESNFTGPSSFKRTPNSFSTPRTTNATRGVSRASPRTSGILAMLGQPGVEVKPPQIGDTINTDLYISACSTLSASSSSDSSSSGSYSSCSDASGASNSAILTISEVSIQETSAFANKQSLLGNNFSTSRGSASFTSHLHTSNSDSDDDIFSSIDDTSVEDARESFFQKHAAAGLSLESRSLHENYTMASRNNSLVDGSVSSSSSGEYSSSDSQTEFDDVEAHIQMAQEWYMKMKSAFLGQSSRSNKDGNSATKSTVDNTVQCEYAGVLGRLKIDINQNK